MVWVHGGGWVIGAGSYDQYGPDMLVAEGVVVVTLNYRLGAFGEWELTLYFKVPRPNALICVVAFSLFNSLIVAVLSCHSCDLVDRPFIFTRGFPKYGETFSLPYSTRLKAIDPRKELKRQKHGHNWCSKGEQFYRIFLDSNLRHSIGQLRTSNLSPDAQWAILFASSEEIPLRQQ